MDKGDLEDYVNLAFVIGIGLSCSGVFAALYSVVSSTPDPPFFYSTIYPFEAFSMPLIVIGLVLIIIGFVMLTQFFRYKGQIKAH